jgi:hypothetical protein
MQYDMSCQRIACLAAVAPGLPLACTPDASLERPSKNCAKASHSEPHKKSSVQTTSFLLNPIKTRDRATPDKTSRSLKKDLLLSVGASLFEGNFEGQFVIPFIPIRTEMRQKPETPS